MEQGVGGLRLAQGVGGLIGCECQGVGGLIGCE